MVRPYTGFILTISSCVCLILLHIKGKLAALVHECVLYLGWSIAQDSFWSSLLVSVCSLSQWMMVLIQVCPPQYTSVMTLSSWTYYCSDRLNWKWFMITFTRTTFFTFLFDLTMFYFIVMIYDEMLYAYEWKCLISVLMCRWLECFRYLYIIIVNWHWSYYTTHVNKSRCSILCTSLSLSF